MGDMDVQNPAVGSMSEHNPYSEARRFHLTPVILRRTLASHPIWKKSMRRMRPHEFWQQIRVLILMAVCCQLQLRL